ncbi:Sexual development transcription factor NsdD [Balamuthia mandrillaris]
MLSAETSCGVRGEEQPSPSSSSTSTSSSAHSTQNNHHPSEGTMVTNRDKLNASTQRTAPYEPPSPSSSSSSSSFSSSTIATTTMATNAPGAGVGSALQKNQEPAKAPLCTTTSTNATRTSLGLPPAASLPSSSTTSKGEEWQRPHPSNYPYLYDQNSGYTISKAGSASSRPHFHNTRYGSPSAQQQQQQQTGSVPSSPSSPPVNNIATTTNSSNSTGTSPLRARTKQPPSGREDRDQPPPPPLSPSQSPQYLVSPSVTAPPLAGAGGASSGFFSSSASIQRTTPHSAPPSSPSSATTTTAPPHAPPVPRPPPLPYLTPEQHEFYLYERESRWAELQKLIAYLQHYSLSEPPRVELSKKKYFDIYNLAIHLLHCVEGLDPDRMRRNEYFACGQASPYTSAVVSHHSIPSDAGRSPSPVAAPERTHGANVQRLNMAPTPPYYTSEPTTGMMTERYPNTMGSSRGIGPPDNQMQFSPTGPHHPSSHHLSPAGNSTPIPLSSIKSDASVGVKNFSGELFFDNIQCSGNEKKTKRVGYLHSFCYLLYCVLLNPFFVA